MKKVIMALAVCAGTLALAADEEQQRAQQQEQAQQQPGQAQQPPGQAQQRPGQMGIQPVMVQGFVRSASQDKLVLTAPGAPQALTLQMDEKTRVLSGTESRSVQDLQEGQFVRAALLPMGQQLLAIVVEVVPQQQAPQQPGAQQQQRQREQQQREQQQREQRER